MIKYKTEKYSNNISEVACIKETDSFVTIIINGWNGKQLERREKKTTDYCRYHDSWDDAYSYILARAENRLESAKKALHSYHEEYEKVKAMRNK